MQGCLSLIRWIGHQKMEDALLLQGKFSLYIFLSCLLSVKYCWITTDHVPLGEGKKKTATIKWLISLLKKYLWIVLLASSPSLSKDNRLSAAVSIWKPWDFIPHLFCFGQDENRNLDIKWVSCLHKLQQWKILTLFACSIHISYLNNAHLSFLITGLPVDCSLDIAHIWNILELYTWAWIKDKKAS